LDCSRNGGSRSGELSFVLIGPIGELGLAGKKTFVKTDLHRDTKKRFKKSGTGLAPKLDKQLTVLKKSRDSAFVHSLAVGKEWGAYRSS